MDNNNIIKINNISDIKLPPYNESLYDEKPSILYSLPDYFKILEEDIKKSIALLNNNNI